MIVLVIVFNDDNDNMIVILTSFILSSLLLTYLDDFNEVNEVTDTINNKKHKTIIVFIFSNMYIDYIAIQLQLVYYYFSNNYAYLLLQQTSTFCVWDSPHNLLSFPKLH